MYLLLQMNILIWPCCATFVLCLILVPLVLGMVDLQFCLHSHASCCCVFTFNHHYLCIPASARSLIVIVIITILPLYRIQINKIIGTYSSLNDHLLLRILLQNHTLCSNAQDERILTEWEPETRWIPQIYISLDCFQTNFLC